MGPTRISQSLTNILKPLSRNMIEKVIRGARGPRPMGLGRGEGRPSMSPTGKC